MEKQYKYLRTPSRMYIYIIYYGKKKMYKSIQEYLTKKQKKQFIFLVNKNDYFMKVNKETFNIQEKKKTVVMSYQEILTKM